jgi:membrane-associated phospholipid phosphatase
MRYLVVGTLLACLALPAAAASRNGNATITAAGTGVAIALPVIAGGIAFSKHDWTGVAQLSAETALTVGTAYALKQVVHEKRPDGSDFQSFPSDTTALAASGSSFLWGRYGWQYGLPAFAASQFVSYSRVQAKEHHFYDTLASSAIAFGYSYFVTTRFRGRYNVDTSLYAAPDGAHVKFSYAW